MSLFQYKQVRWYCFFLIFFSILLLGMNVMCSINQVNYAKEIYISNNGAIASYLLEKGISREVVADALANSKVSETGKELLVMVGIDHRAAYHKFPYLDKLRKSSLYVTIPISLLLVLVLLSVTSLFFWRRKQLFLQADKVIGDYINGDFSHHLPQNSEGAIYQVFSSVERLATMLKSKMETEHKIKEFLKNTISDISHQLKTPLAAIAMYQEIIDAEPGNTETVKEFSAKIGASLNRMEQLIQLMLKITRLDAGSIVFEKRYYSVPELISNSINELTARARKEHKQIIVDGDPRQQIFCDMEWTSEAIGNIVKNALDHTGSGGVIRITWEQTPAMVRISVTDNGDGIAPEDIYHIFKRFYRSKNIKNMKTTGIGLGLPLAKSIVEGQGGVISVQSERHHGTTFTLSFLTE